MHSRIFQVSTEPIDREDYITEGDYYDHWFLVRIADYVQESDREADIAWISESAKGVEFGKDDYGNFLIVTDRKEYFRKSYGLFIKILNNISNRMTLGNFSEGTLGGIHRLVMHYEDEYGFYIDNDGNGCLEPLDKFVRTCKLGTKYYIGGTIDYHY